MKIKFLITVITGILILQVKAAAQLSGAYTIGNGGSYTTLNDAVTALMSQGISGPVTFDILNGSYNEQIRIGNINGVSSSNTVTFKSHSGNASDVQIFFSATGTNDNYVVSLDSAKYVNFQNLTLLGTGNSFCRVFLLSAPSSDITVTNNIIAGTTNNSSSDNQALIFSNNTIVNNLEVSGNSFTDGSYAIYLSGVNSSNTFNGLKILNNEITASYIGIRINYASAPQINQNQISLYSTADWGFYLQNCNGGLEIIKNKFSLSNAHGLYLNNSTGGNPPVGTRGLIANNFISTGGDKNGLYLSTISNQDIYYNSVNLNSGSNANSKALYVDGNGSEVNFVNNVFANQGDGYAYYIQNSSPVSQSDYNDIFTIGSKFAYWNGDKQNLTELQSAGGKDQNSISADPQFVSSTNLHVRAAELDSAGTPFASVSDDIDGDLRNQNFPDIGADEFIFGFNTAPVITSEPDTLVFVDSLYQYQVIAKDQDGDTLIYSLTTAPGFLSIDENSGLIEGAPSSNDIGEHPVSIMVDDGHGNQVNQSYTLYVENPTGIYDLANQIPDDYIIFQNYPNPFNPLTVIRYGLPDYSHVKIEVFNISGQRVYILTDEEKPAGYYEVEFNAASLSSGIYLYRIQAGSFLETRKMTLIK